MATVDEPRTRSHHGEHRSLIRDVGWDGYQELLEAFEQGGPRITYDRGTVELMSPLIQHERPNRLIARIIETITEELDIQEVNAGSTTYKSQILDRGLEPDTCYYFANAHRLRRYSDDLRMDLEIDPVPDLAIEIEITRALIDKLPIYAALGIPEIWHYNGMVLKILLLGPQGDYTSSETSASFPFVPMADVNRFLVENDGTNDTRWGREVRRWVREVVAPRYRG